MTLVGHSQQILREVITQWQVQDKNLLRLMGITDMEDDEPLVVPLIVMPYLGGGHPMDVLKTGTPLKLLSMVCGNITECIHQFLPRVATVAPRSGKWTETPSSPETPDHPRRLTSRE